MSVTREIELQVTPEEVWEALATEEGRERWLGEPERDIHVELAQAPHRLVWWWAGEREPATRVEFLIVRGTELHPATRVIVTESMPARLPLAMLAASLRLVAA
ncbi:MAG TPA: hypothetical protein VGY13_05780 [Solirubrobacteraceae bacterium]|nr:hypothetical protein [Solirubrobacteraceae bacterium]